MKKLFRLAHSIWFHLMLSITSNPYKVAEIWRKQGVEIGTGTCVYHDVVFSDGGERISIGRSCVLTGCVILTHDASTNKLLGLEYGEPSLEQPVVIEDDCFIGYHSIILMGVRIGKGSIVGAGAVVTRDVPPGTVVAGNPAQIVCTVDELIQKRVQHIKLHPEIFPAGLEKLNTAQNARQE
jgi:acetyltransferase-like isoleucine patch superfamily enzyme